MIYPVTIISDRYDGVYSGGKWTAWNLDESEIPEDASGDDLACYDFWNMEEKPVCGIGQTPNEAYEDLKMKIENLSKYITL